VIGDFIITFEHNALTKDEVSEWDETDFFLEGMVKGMWIVYNMIEEQMVRERKEHEQEHDNHLSFGP
jgi:hypothetical protein